MWLKRYAAFLALKQVALKKEQNVFLYCCQQRPGPNPIYATISFMLIYIAKLVHLKHSPGFVLSLSIQAHYSNVDFSVILDSF